MTWLPGCEWSLIRATLVSLAVGALGTHLARHLETAHRLHAAAIWLALATLCATPELVVGYAWGDTGLSLLRAPAINELLYAALLVGKLTPLATVLFCVAPADALTSTAWHCRKLAPRRSPARELLAFWLAGPARRAAPIVAGVFLLAFQDFELASRLGVRSWTVSLFDLHAREGLPLEDSVRLTVWPVVIQLTVVAPTLVLAMTWADRTSLPAVIPAERGLGNLVVRTLTAIFVIVVVLVPVAVVLRGTVAGWMVLFREAVYREALPREIGIGIGVATIAALGAFLLGGGLAATLPRRWEFSLLLLPGLLGPLVVSLIGRNLVQHLDRWWEPATGRPGLYNTPVPLVLAQMAILLPRATLIHLVLPAVTQLPAAHLGDLLSRSHARVQRQTGAELTWRFRRRGQFWSIGLLAWWGYWDLTTFSLLAPTGFVSAPVRLYNFMHYQQNAVLSAMVTAAVLLPVGVVILCCWVARWASGRQHAPRIRQ